MSDLVSVIQVTNNYNQFKILESNRAVDTNHIRRLGKSMRENPHLFATRPILVNEHMFVIDGQHRLAAAKENRLPVYYMIGDGITVDDTRALNTTQSNWKMTDFAKSYASTGNESYKAFLSAVAKYPSLPLTVIRHYMGGSTAENEAKTADFKSGNFHVPQPEVSDVYLEQLSEIKQRSGANSITRATGVAFLKLFSNPDVFDYDYFITKVGTERAETLSMRHLTVKDALRNIEDVYNHNRAEKNRVRFY